MLRISKFKIYNSMNCVLRKIRAKVGIFRELREDCVKKSDDFNAKVLLCPNPL